MKSLFALLLLFSWPLVATEIPTFVLDKSKFQLHIANYKNDSLEIFKTFPVTLGKNSGDKILEGDLKTPEGIYRFTAKYLPPQIQKKLGAMAFYVDYPNAVDVREKKTGYAIMLHATDDPSRLERNQDSDGCIVTSDEKITEMGTFIYPPYSILLVYDTLKPEYITANQTQKVKQAFTNWLAAWNSKDIEAYIASYASDFKFEAMDIAKYKNYKNILNKKYDVIDVKATDVKYFYHPKYEVVTFTQEYSATFPNGKKAFVSRGQKRLYFVNEADQLKIYSEEFSRMSM